MIEVYLDDGHIHIPDTVSIPSMPWEVVEPVRWALARVLDPGIGERDSVFSRERSPRVKSQELLVCWLQVVGSSPGLLSQFYIKL